MKSKMKIEGMKFSAMNGQPRDVQYIPDKLPYTSAGLYVPYGPKNDYPDYLNMLCDNSPIMNAIVRSMMDYIMGESMQFSPIVRAKLLGNRKTELKRMLKRIVYDKVITNGFALKLTYNRQQEIALIEWLDIRNVRINADFTKAYYSETFGKGRRGELEEYDLWEVFEPGKDGIYSCIYYDNNEARGIYPQPTYMGALRAIETSIDIEKFHLSSIQLNLSASAVISIPDAGNYSEEEKKEVERKFRDNFCGESNGSNFILSFCEDKDHAVVIEKLDDEGFDKKYEALSKNTRDGIFAGFRMQSALCGYLADTVGFTTQEYAEAFKIYNKTVIQPLQRYLVSCFDELFNVENSLEIVPFNIKFDEE